MAEETGGNDGDSLWLEDKSTTVHLQDEVEKVNVKRHVRKEGIFDHARQVVSVATVLRSSVSSGCCGLSESKKSCLLTFKIVVYTLLLVLYNGSSRRVVYS